MRPVLSKAIFLIFLSQALAQHRPGQVTLGPFYSGIKLVGGESDNSMINYMAGLSIRYSFSKHLTGEVTGGIGWVRPRTADSHFDSDPALPYRTYLYPWSANLRFHLFPNCCFVPFVGAGIGLTHWDLRDVGGEDKWFPIPASGESVDKVHTNLSVIGSFGFTLFITRHFNMEIAARYSHLLDQPADNIGTSLIMGGTGDANNGLAEVRLTLGFALGGEVDSDGDGIDDRDDANPYQPEDKDGFQDEDGAPDPDNDNDGIPDESDGSPNMAEDKDGFQDEDGIPDPDNDGDGIPDLVDRCPNEPEDKDGFQDEDGCPDPDNDGDGIPDAQDQCPNEPETKNGYQDEDGCPDQVPKAAETQVRTAEPAQPPVLERGKKLILPGVTFQTGKAVLRENAKRVLDLIVQSLQNYPDIKLEIRGYTDSQGSASLNLNLSQRRADAVKDYLVKQGIAFDRLRSIGYGEADPIASNATAEGRSQNRRIEFHPIG